MSQAKNPRTITISPNGELSEHKQRALVSSICSVHPNGGRHTYSSQAIIRLALEAERRCENLILSKSMRVGARLTATSGAPVAKAYGYARLATQVELVRAVRGWQVVSITATEVQSWGGDVTLLLSREQITQATHQLLKQIGAEAM